MDSIRPMVKLKRSFERYYIPLALGIIFILVLSYVLEYVQSRSDLYELLQEEAYLIVEALHRSSENILLATEEIEYQIQERLVNNARSIAYIDSCNQLTGSLLASFVTQNNLERIRVFRSPNHIVYDTKKGVEHRLPDSLLSLLNHVLARSDDVLFLDPVIDQGDTIIHYAVAVPRRGAHQGIILVEIHSSVFSDLRKSFGIGKLLRDVIGNRTFVYAALQDSVGILAASGAFEELSSINSDPFLRATLHSNHTFTRTLDLHNQRVYEVVRSFVVSGEHFGLIRVGMSLERINELEKRMLYRSLFLVMVLLTILFLAIEANRRVLQNYQQIEAMERYTRTLLEQMEDAVITLDDYGVVQFFNKRAEVLFDTSAEFVLKKPFTEGLTQYSEFIERVTNLRAPEEMDVSFPDGRKFSLSVAVTRTDHLVTAVIRDRTEMKRIEQELQRREKYAAMGELASAVAHEIRNPLNAISLIVQRLASEFVPKKDVRGYRSLVDVLGKEIQRLNGIVHQFLTFARLPKPTIKPVPVEHFLEHLSTLFQPLAQQRGVHFKTYCHFHGTAQFDPEQLTQVLFNLFQNALDATPQGGSIEVAALHEHGKLLFRVHDTGKGIPSELLGKVFDLYVTTKPSGIGMGLPMAQQIVYRHGGTIEVRSAENQGTTFTVSLPLQG